MNRESTHTEVKQVLALVGALGLLTMGLANAQVPVDDDGYPITPIGSVDDSGASSALQTPLLTAAELESLVGPVALYPDDLLAIVLPASTYPLEIVQAARFLERHEVDPTLKPDEDWDESIIALLNYPEVVQMMNDDLDWTWKLGEAVVAQQSDLIAAVETFRDRAYAAGNLKTDEHQTVSIDDGIIEIDPVEEDIIYVPYYEPERVVVYSPSPVYHYYPQPYPVYYYPYSAGHYFGSSFFWGVSTAFTIGWAHDYLHVYHHSYFGHPYYGHSYYGNHYWRHPSIYSYNHYYVNNHHNRSHDYNHHGDYWRPRHRGGARPVNQVARNTYYSGSQRSDSRGPSYRDGRTDGLAYNGNNRSSTSTADVNRPRQNNTARDSNRASTRTGNRSSLTSTARREVQFRERDNRVVTGSVAARPDRSTNRSSRQTAERQANVRTTARRSDTDNIRFRERQSADNLQAAARQPRRATTSANNSLRSRTSSAANNTSRTVRNTQRRTSSATSTPTVHRSTAPRVSSTRSQPTVRSQPRHQSVSRPASPPRQSQPSHSSRPSAAPRSSSQQQSAPRSQASARSSNHSGSRRSSDRKRK